MKNLDKNTYYKFYIEAQKKVNGKYKRIASSEDGHVITGNVRSNYTNPKSLTITKSALTLKTGKTYTLKGKVEKVINNKKLGTNHAKELRFVSSNTKVAKVDAKGKITAVHKGTCTIYVQTINGIWKTCKVTVK